MAAGADHVSQLSMDASLRVWTLWTLWSLSFPLKLFQDSLVAGRAMLLSQERRSQQLCDSREVIGAAPSKIPAQLLSLSLSLSGVWSVHISLD